MNFARETNQLLIVHVQMSKARLGKMPSH